MKAITKTILVSASVLSMGALTACQSTNNVQSETHPKMMKQHHDQREHRLTPEQREKFQQKRAEYAELQKQIRQACDNKAVGSTVQVKAGEKTIDGTCNIYFKADRKDMKAARAEFRGMKGEHRPMRGDFRAAPGQGRGEPMTDAQRAEMVKQFDQRLAQRQAQQKAVIQACQGKKDGAAAQIKIGNKTINGQCHVRFQPKAPVAAPAAKAS
ncbi:MULTISPECIES: hypothetical protein [Acinetobacter]|uniref:hypothetical protein n=1 Tax=Acinetobacter TaxID=469 RepID=UPI0005385E1D|nr:hypothetical protein [Acinetobacter sp. HR7]KGT48025.1 hypothetical protein GW12_09460 [Acinetobacter sp. HR7]